MDEIFAAIEGFIKKIFDLISSIMKIFAPEEEGTEGAEGEVA